MKNKYYPLLLLVPLSEAKALFYNSNLKVDWYLFSNNKRHLCNVVEDYANVVVFGVLFFYICFIKLDIKIRKFCLFLFIVNGLDFFHLGLLDKQGFILVKWALAILIYKYAENKVNI